MSFDPSMWFMLSELDAEEEREKCGELFKLYHLAIIR